MDGHILQYLELAEVRLIHILKQNEKSGNHLIYLSLRTQRKSCPEHFEKLLNGRFLDTHLMSNLFSKKDFLY